MVDSKRRWSNTEMNLWIFNRLRPLDLSVQRCHSTRWVHSISSSSKMQVFDWITIVLTWNQSTLSDGGSCWVEIQFNGVANCIPLAVSELFQSNWIWNEFIASLNAHIPLAVSEQFQSSFDRHVSATEFLFWFEMNPWPWRVPLAVPGRFCDLWMNYHFFCNIFQEKLKRILEDLAAGFGVDLCTAEFARHMDAVDPLKDFRSLFAIPLVKDLPCGTSTTNISLLFMQISTIISDYVN